MHHKQFQEEQLVGIFESIDSEAGSILAQESSSSNDGDSGGSGSDGGGGSGGSGASGGGGSGGGPDNVANGMDADPVMWPDLGERLNDFLEPNIQALAFPTLFLNGDGDATNCDQKKMVSFHDASMHLVKYAVRNTQTGLLHYPFVEHPQWMCWAQNTDECHCISQQVSI